MAKAANKDTSKGKGSKGHAAKDDADAVRKDFGKAVNMTAAELRKWLKTEDSKRVGDKGDKRAGESVGHKSGKRIVRILGTADADLTDKDLAHMRKVRGYVKRHLAQRPSGDVTHTDWRYSLMNWGHDPAKG